MVSGRSFAIIGAGQTGLLAGHALLQQGHDVTLYSDKTPDQFLSEAHPTGTAARFDMSLEWERKLGLEHWGESHAPQGEGVNLHFLPEKNNPLLMLSGRLQDYFLAIDVRLQSARWMEEFDEAGGEVRIDEVSIEQLDDIEAENDLVLVAAGKGEIGDLFPVDQQRTSYTEPQRYLAMVNVTGVDERPPYCDHYTPVKFNFFPKFGEIFYVPWLSKDLEKSWSLVFEAKHDGPIDRFQDVTSGPEALEVAKNTIKDMCPWDYHWFKDAQICDENSWLRGSFTPEIRRVDGELPSGRSVMAVGDTCHRLDPIGGMGANNCNKMARWFVDAIEERGEKPFTKQWMRDTFDGFWERHGSWIERFNNTLLEPLTEPGKMLLLAQQGSRGVPRPERPQDRIANEFCQNFNDPKRITSSFHDAEEARGIILDTFGTDRWSQIPGQLWDNLGLPGEYVDGA